MALLLHRASGRAISSGRAAVDLAGEVLMCTLTSCSLALEEALILTVTSCRTVDKHNKGEKSQYVDEYTALQSEFTQQPKGTLLKQSRPGSHNDYANEWLRLKSETWT